MGEDSRGDAAPGGVVNPAAHRPELLRHCYRMLGSFADAEDVVQDVLLKAWDARAQYRGDVPLVHWLMRIATNRCLDELAKKKRRALPNLERPPTPSYDHLEELEAADWITPAPDDVLETREGVALAFIALLQRLPAKQRAALLLKDVVGWSADEIADALELSVSATNSALHRAREAIARPELRHAEPSPDVVRAYIRSWEERDLTALVALLHEDVTLAMPPHAMWFHGATVGAFFASQRFSGFWNRQHRLVPIHANGQLAMKFYSEGAPHSIQLVTFEGDRVIEMIQFIGAAYFRGF
ncbi:MAG: RNA polymerase subunit sigma-70 [Kofleriaceae bacterium]